MRTDPAFVLTTLAGLGLVFITGLAAYVGAGEVWGAILIFWALYLHELLRHHPAMSSFRRWLNKA